MQQQPAWLEQAWLELGQREEPGSSDNPRIMALYRDAGVVGVRHDEAAWCAAFVGACLERSGAAGTRSLMARSYLEWGRDAVSGSDAAADHLGAIVVLRRGGDPSAGHVGFLVGSTPSSVVLLGGNQSNAVTVAAFDRGDVLGVRSPALPSAAKSSPDADAEDQLFEVALAHVLEMEGGFTNDPADPGGPTKLGLTLADLAAWHGVALDGEARPKLLEELRRLDVAAARPIYRQRYWQSSRADALPPGLALMHFDCAVNQGLGRAARFLQRSVEADIDGEIGPQTLEAAARSDFDVALQSYAAQRRSHYRGLATFGHFGRGWLARVESTLTLALRLQAASRLHPPRVEFSVNHRGDAPMSTVDSTATPPVAQGSSTIPGEPKWWGRSMTVWGALITAAATVMPALGPLVGVDLSAETIRQIGGQAAETVRAVAGLAGTILAIYGRARAAQPLMRRDFSLRI